MEQVKKVGKELIALEKTGNVFVRLDGNGVWQEMTNKELFKLLIN